MPIGAGAEVAGAGLDWSGAGDAGVAADPAADCWPPALGTGAANGETVDVDGIPVAGVEVLGSSGIGFSEGVGASAGGVTGCGWIDACGAAGIATPAWGLIGC